METNTMFELLWYAVLGILAMVAFFGLLLLNIRLERARRRAEEEMTASEREEKEAFAKAAGGTGWISPF
jgi:hypothetical protein